MVKGNRTCEEGATELVYQGREEGKDPETMVEEVELERCMHEPYCKSVSKIKFKNKQECGSIASNSQNIIPT